MFVQDSTPRHIFVVGMPRTGTNLVRNILNSATKVHCAIGQETHFVGGYLSRGGRGQMHRIGDMHDDANVVKLVDTMFAENIPGNYWKHLADGDMNVTRDQMLKAILATDRSDRAIYEVLLTIEPGITPDTIIGDKTPGHVFHVPRIMDWFPNAKIVHTFRDPRAIYVSQIKKKRDKGVRGMRVPFKPGTPAFNFGLLVYTLTGWRYAAHLHERFRKAYPNQYRLVQFEDLVTDPTSNLNELCQFLNMELEPEMLEPIHPNSSYLPGAFNSGFDPNVLTRWREHISPAAELLFQAVAGKTMREFGYT